MEYGSRSYGLHRGKYHGCFVISEVALPQLGSDVSAAFVDGCHYLGVGDLGHSLLHKCFDGVYFVMVKTDVTTSHAFAEAARAG